MPKTIVHVNQHIIKANRNNNENNPPLTIKRSGKKIGNAKGVIIRDHGGKEVARVVYSKDKPLSCGATCWIQTELDVELE